MEGIKSYKNIWEVEFKKPFSSGRRKWGLILVVILFIVLPWLTLRNFEEKYESFKWYYLDESYLNFIIYRTVSMFSWMMVIIIPWLYYLLFAEEKRHYLKRSNKLFVRLILTKAAVYALLGFILIAMSWFSTYLLYRYYCGSHGIELESNGINSIVSPAAQLFFRLLMVLPLIVALFLSFPKNSSYLMLVTILLFSAFLVFRIPFHFHYNVHHPEFNWTWTFHALLAGVIFTFGLILYYRFISKKVHVFP